MALNHLGTMALKSDLTVPRCQQEVDGTDEPAHSLKIFSCWYYNKMAILVLMGIAIFMSFDLNPTEWREILWIISIANNTKLWFGSLGAELQLHRFVLVGYIKDC